MARRSPMVPVPFLDGPLACFARDVTPAYPCEGLRTVHHPLTADDIETDDPAGLFPNTRWHVYSAALVDSSEAAGRPFARAGRWGLGWRFVGQLEESDAVRATIKCDDDTR